MVAPKANWLDVEPDYRAGVMTVTAIARKWGVDESAVRKQALRRGWTRAAAAVKAERVKAAMAVGAATAKAAERAASDARDGDAVASAAIDAEVDRDLKFLDVAARFYETVLTTTAEQFPAWTSTADQKRATETAVLATTMYRRLRGLDDRPAGKGLEEMLAEL